MNSTPLKKNGTVYKKSTKDTNRKISKELFGKIIILLFISNGLFFYFINSSEEVELFNPPKDYVLLKIKAELKTKFAPYQNVSIITAQNKLIQNNILMEQYLPTEFDISNKDEGRSYLLWVNQKNISLLSKTGTHIIYPPLTQRPTMPSNNKGPHEISF